jgi:hypothetical protein
MSNLTRLALTFRRPMIGVHNRTWGIIFDLIQCIIERNFSYPTMDIRNSYALVKACLIDEENTKVVLILHSQGGIEGGLILDWLLSECESSSSQHPLCSSARSANLTSQYLMTSFKS